MGTNQKYSQRVHTKRQLNRVTGNCRESATFLESIGSRYEQALPRVAAACGEMIQLLFMLESMIDDIRDNI